MNMSLKIALNNWSAAPSNANRLVHKRNKLPDEESFFNAMMDYFNLRPFAVAIHAEKTHQGYVLPGNAKPKCEISDVFFIVYSRQHHVIRMTHMEVKKKSEMVSLPLNSVSSFKHPLHWRQHQLLNGRMPFANFGNSHYPGNTFCNPLFSDSIASYGVIYIDSNNEWNIAYEVASLINQLGNKRGEYTLLPYNRGYINIYSNLFIPPHSWRQFYSKGDNCLPFGGELIYTLDTDDFERGLCMCQVGSHLFPGDQTSNELLAYVKDMFEANQADISPEKQDLIADFSGYIRDERFEQRDTLHKRNVYPINIVLVNADLTKDQEIR